MRFLPSLISSPSTLSLTLVVVGRRLQCHPQRQPNRFDLGVNSYRRDQVLIGGQVDRGTGNAVSVEFDRKSSYTLDIDDSTL